MDTQKDTVFQEYVAARAHIQGEPLERVQADITPDKFYEQLAALHKEYMAADISFGYMAEQLGINRFALTRLLDELGMPATQGW
jgi:hypothetical protein